MVDIVRCPWLCSATAVSLITSKRPDLWMGGVARHSHGDVGNGVALWLLPDMDEFHAWQARHARRSGSGRGGLTIRGHDGASGPLVQSRAAECIWCVQRCDETMSSWRDGLDSSLRRARHVRNPLRRTGLFTGHMSACTLGNCFCSDGWGDGMGPGDMGGSVMARLLLDGNVGCLDHGVWRQSSACVREVCRAWCEGRRSHRAWPVERQRDWCRGMRLVSSELWGPHEVI